VVVFVESFQNKKKYQPLSAKYKAKELLQIKPQSTSDDLKCKCTSDGSAFC